MSCGFKCRKRGQKRQLRAQKSRRIIVLQRPGRVKWPGCLLHYAKIKKKARQQVTTAGTAPRKRRMVGSRPCRRVDLFSSCLRTALLSGSEGNRVKTYNCLWIWKWPVSFAMKNKRKIKKYTTYSCWFCYYCLPLFSYLNVLLLDKLYITW